MPNLERQLYFANENYASFKHRTIYFTDEVDSIYDSMVVAFHQMDQEEGPIKMIINTPGGDISSMFSIYDIIRLANNEVWGIGTGEVCSAGVLILAGCHKRYVTENCVLMSHKGSTSFSGNIEDLESRTKWYKWMSDRWPELMSRHTPNDAAYWKRVQKREAELWILGGENIVQAGIADQVITGNLKEFLDGVNVG